MGTDQDWRDWGRQDPYFAVITDERFRADRLDEQARAEFFASGEQHVQHVMREARNMVGGDFRPARALDFGCGVGRVAIPLCSQADEVVGVDVSPDMLEEATRNAARQGVSNLKLLPSDDQLSAVSGQFQLVHSAIVLQHIPPVRGRELFALLLERIAPGGVGAFQVTYGKAQFCDSYGQLPPEANEEPTRPSLRALLGLHRPAASSQPVAGASDPPMLMHSYNLSELAFLVQRAGVQHMRLEFTDHGGELGVFMFFRTPG